MNWLVEQSIRNESFWLIASIVSGFLYFYDERSWRGLSVHGFQYEMQRYLIRIVPMSLLSVALPLIATMHKGILWHAFITIVSASLYHVFQRCVHDFSGRTLTGPAKRIHFVTAIFLITAAMLPIIPLPWVPLLFVIAGVATSLSSRNHLIFKLSEETLAIRQRLTTNQAERHNAQLFKSLPPRLQSTGDNTLKAG